VSSKHQSLWETFALLPLLSDPAYIMKRELMWIPFFGWYTWKAGMIAVDRGKGSQALAEMNASARQEAARGRQIIIFPEGTPARPRAGPGFKVRNLASLPGARVSVPADRAQFRPVLAAPVDPPLSRHHPRRGTRPDPAWARQGGLFRTAAARGRSRDRAP